MNRMRSRGFPWPPLSLGLFSAGLVGVALGGLMHRVVMWLAAIRARASVVD